MSWPDGRKFNGVYIYIFILHQFYKDNEKDGNGTFSWPDGSTLEGVWKNGKL